MRNCRFYEQRYPGHGDIVRVRVDSILDTFGAYVSLLEYDCKEGLLLFQDVGGRRNRYSSLIGRQILVQVLRVDSTKGYIDLSRRRLAPEEVKKCEEKFNKAKVVHSIMCHLAQVTDIDLELLNSTISWPLYRMYGHAFDAFKAAITDPDRVFETIDFPNENIQNQLLEIIQHEVLPDGNGYHQENHTQGRQLNT